MATPKGKTLGDFRAVHDLNVIVPNKIRAALAAMLKESNEQWEYEVDFMKRATISPTNIAAFRDQFAEHIVQTPHVHGRQSKRVWFADPKVARKARGE